MAQISADQTSAPAKKRRLPDESGIFAVLVAVIVALSVISPSFRTVSNSFVLLVNGSVITFLALLEMCRLRLIRVYQSDPLAPIHLELAVSSEPKAVAQPEALPPAQTETIAEAGDAWNREDEGQGKE